MNCNGIFTALLTPFGRGGRINEQELEKLVKYNCAMGVTGFYVGGSTAEAFLLTTDERKQILDVVKSAAPEKTLIAHVGSVNEAEAVALGSYAAGIGYDMVSAVAPFYYKFSFEDIKKYYYHIADAAGIPMLVYHFPALSGVNMGIREMGEFLQDDRFAGIKYTSNDFFTMEQCRAHFPNKLIYNGFDEMFMAGVAMGASGGIGSTYNFMANKFIEIWDLMGGNKLEEARAIQQEANRIIAILCQIGVMQAEKEVLNQLGFDFGICRRPFGEPTQEQKALIAREIIPFLQK